MVQQGFASNAVVCESNMTALLVEVAFVNSRF